jgi:hypothetical protein
MGRVKIQPRLSCSYNKAMRPQEAVPAAVGEGRSYTGIAAGQVAPNKTVSLNGTKPDFYEFNNAKIKR